MQIEYIIIGILVGIVAAILFTKREKNTQDAGIMSERLDRMNQNVTDSLGKVTDRLLTQLNETTRQVNERLKENSEMIQVQHKSVGERLDNAAKAVNTVTGKLSQIEEGNKRIYDVGKDIASLQEILKAPKLRGGLGEYFLQDLLAQIFPANRFTMQYGFKSGEKVDAVIHVRDNHIIPVDAKFPLENFKKMIEENHEKEKAQFKKVFVSDVKKRIDEIATKYILPDEGTLDFALMYVPAENVYYETIVKDQQDGKNLSSYAFSKHVIPVSPNTFYIYLQTILMGLRGFQVEKEAKQILASLSGLRGDFEKFGADFSLIGKHMTHAKLSYENSEKRLSKFSDKLSQVESLSGARETEKLVSPEHVQIEEIA